MLDERFFKPISDQTPFRQGDVIRRDPIGSSQPSWGVIITADCDIAQEKMGEFYTYLVVRSARDYVEQVWAGEELLKLAERHRRVAIEGIHEADQIRDANAIPLTAADLTDWAAADGATAILNAIGVSNNRVRSRLEAAIEIALIANQQTSENVTSLQLLKACWSREGKKAPEQSGAIRNALNPRQMRSDYMLLPALPAEREVGFVVMLRDVRAIRSTELFMSRLDRRIGDGDDATMYRIGRFSDFIRYAIAQRMATLFSRIGMTEHFESESEVAANLILESIHSSTDER
ncbi:hypothetical protein [Bradyrhizobium sp. B039]|uniref:hypothetical protein n=1 Tax=Bradyrhizobium sp. B039 TaxID=3140239 RepID=UPI003182EA5A